MNDETGRRSVASVDESSASKIKFPAGSSSPTPTMTLDPPESPGITITVPRLLVDASPGQDHCNVDDDMECNNNCFREQHGREEQQQHHKQQEQEQQQLQQPQKAARFLSVPMAQLGRRRTSSATQESARAGLMLASVGVSHQSQLARSRTKRNLSAFNLQSYLVRVSPSASSSPKAGDGEKSKPPAWREIDTAVKGLMSGQKMAEGRLHELQTVLRQLSASAFGPLIGDYYRDRLLPQGMATLRNGVLGYDNQTLSNGTGVAPVQLGTVQETVTAMMDRLAATWINFYRTVLPYLEAIFVSIKTQRLTIRETTLVAFRNHVVLKIPLKEAIEHLKNVPNSHQIDGTISEESGTEFGTESKQNARSGTNCAKGKTGFGNFDVKQRIPGISRTNSGAIQQMLLILQGVRDVSTFPTKDQLELEKLVVLVATPYVGHRGLYVRRTDQPDVPSTYRSNNGRLLSTHQQQATGNSPSSKCYHRVHSFNTISSRLATDSLPFGAYLPRARVETLADLLRVRSNSSLLL